MRLPLLGAHHVHRTGRSDSASTGESMLSGHFGSVKSPPVPGYGRRCVFHRSNRPCALSQPLCAGARRQIPSGVGTKGPSRSGESPSCRAPRQPDARTGDGAADWQRRQRPARAPVRPSQGMAVNRGTIRPVAGPGVIAFSRMRNFAIAAGGSESGRDLAPDRSRADMQGRQAAGGGAFDQQRVVDLQ